MYQQIQVQRGMPNWSHLWKIAASHETSILLMDIGWFSEAGLLEWMRFVIFRARSRSALPGRFLSSCCFTLCITLTVEDEPRIATQMPITVAKITVEADGGWGKSVFALLFWLPRWSRVRRKKSVLGHPIARATNYFLFPNTLWLWASKNAFKVGSVKFANSLPPPSIVKKVCTGSKSSQGT